MPNYVRCSDHKRYTEPKNWKEKQNKIHFHNINRKLLRIEYPGIVDNIDKALDTLGGISNVELVTCIY